MVFFTAHFTKDSIQTHAVRLLMAEDTQRPDSAHIAHILTALVPYSNSRCVGF